MKKEEFIETYCKWSKITVKKFYELWLEAYPCSCDYEECKWRCVDSIKNRERMKSIWFYKDTPPSKMTRAEKVKEMWKDCQYYVNRYMERCGCSAKRRWKRWYCSNCWYNSIMDKVAEKEVRRVCKEMDRENKVLTF